MSGRQFQKGQSGNPGGKAKGLEKRTRELLGNDIDAITYVRRCIALGIPPDVERLVVLGITLSDEQRKALPATFSKITCRDVIMAGDSLTDRGWGKPKQHVNIGGKTGAAVPKNMPAMTDEQLRALALLDEDLDGDEALDEELDQADGDAATEH